MRKYMGVYVVFYVVVCCVLFVVAVLGYVYGCVCSLVFVCCVLLYCCLLNMCFAVFVLSGNGKTQLFFKGFGKKRKKVSCNLEKNVKTSRPTNPDG